MNMYYAIIKDNLCVFSFRTCTVWERGALLVPFGGTCLCDNWRPQADPKLTKLKLYQRCMRVTSVDLDTRLDWHKESQYSLILRYEMIAFIFAILIPSLTSTIIRLWRVSNSKIQTDAILADSWRLKTSYDVVKTLPHSFGKTDSESMSACVFYL